jgi:hypothetical protein
MLLKIYFNSEINYSLYTFNSLSYSTDEYSYGFEVKVNFDYYYPSSFEVVIALAYIGIDPLPKNGIKAFRNFFSFEIDKDKKEYILNKIEFEH